MKVIRLKVKDIVVKPGMLMFNSDFRCLEPITKVELETKGEFCGRYCVSSAVDCTYRNPDDELDISFPEEDPSTNG